MYTYIQKYIELFCYDKIVRTLSIHNHAADSAKVKCKQIINNMKVRSKVTGISTHTVVAETCENITAGVSSSLPKINSLKRTVQRTRLVAKAAPSNPKSLSVIIIPLENSKTADGPPFLLKIGDPEIFLIFSTEESLNMLSKCELWCCDGTFS